MKTIFTLLGIFFSLACATGHPVYDKLRTVNQYWSAQQDITFADLPVHGAYSRQGWIQLHLSLVETTLRKRSTSGLTEAQRRNRARCLDYLHSYWQEARFPQNEDYNYRTPIFIDRHDNFCAVGYLVKSSGYEEVSRKIAAQTNLAYVHEMNYPELTAWAEAHGFTKDELAWIQPGYPPEVVAMSIGKGTDGSIYALYPDDTKEMLFAGGSFNMADSTLPANNIAYITEMEGTFTWHTMGGGVNGTVYAITRYDDHIFVAGNFSEAGSTSVNNVAYWDGQNWHKAGCISGIVKDMAVFNGDLFASGRFDVCTSDTGINFARWNGNVWEAIPGVSGIINTMEPLDTILLLGGSFTYNNDTVNVIRWQASGDFIPYSNDIRNEVNDFALFKNVMYAVCKHTAAADDTFLFQKLTGNDWEPADTLYFKGENPSMNCLHIEEETFSSGQWQWLLCGGHFHFDKTYIDPPGSSVNLASITPEAGYGTWIHVDSGVHAITNFKGYTILGGDFKSNYYEKPLGGIAHIPKRRTGVNDRAYTHNQVHIYPNPASPHDVLRISSEGTVITSFTLWDIGGKEIFHEGEQWDKSGMQITLPGLKPGFYIAEIHNSEGTRSISKLLIE